ncbi:CDP-alcohol phosphatidyltransferase family protein [Crocosphaera chwakensis]|uniref:CDP-diacylglycerol--glycerol-3-phosphate 3-phosphatidyltransferase n=1 Tax=Crocosphaera chwakensis CCY0110 TaxID=391612 RepID=A3IK08_9CHRO|nr:CDP-alcohol phosphatidyltransferase family protein [Crocosphaera chwakensis]EAZ92997.1 hypothetical protein CY0110_02974 [Crocosphaera chwakensis CCY0110]
MPIKLTSIPSILVGLRFVLALLLFFDALDHQTSWFFILAYLLAVFSDIFDGIIARRLNVSTIQLRQADSWADICLYLCVALSIWLVYPQVLIDFRLPLLLAVAAQVTLFSLSLLKFRKFPSFHTYTAKFWGLTLLIATVSLFVFNNSVPFWLAIALCYLNSIEEIVMVLVLPIWQCDILSVFEAMEKRKSLLLEADSVKEA